MGFITPDGFSYEGNYNMELGTGYAFNTQASDKLYPIKLLNNRAMHKLKRLLLRRGK